MSNLFKAGWYAVQDNEARVIDSNALVAEKIKKEASRLSRREVKESNDGFTAGLEADNIELLTDTDESGNAVRNGLAEEKERMDMEIAQAKQDLAELMSQIERQKQDAVAEMESLRINAMEEGQEQGYRDGYKKGYEESEKVKLEYQNKQKQLEADYKLKLEELEPKFIDVLTGIYEHIFRVDLGNYQNLISNLLTEALLQIESSKNYMIHVAKEDYEMVNSQKEYILSEAGITHANVEIISDMSLGGNMCMIETESGVFDCGLDTELKELERKLKLLSYEK